MAWIKDRHDALINTDLINSIYKTEFVDEAGVKGYVIRAICYHKASSNIVYAFKTEKEADIKMQELTVLLNGGPVS